MIERHATDRRFITVHLTEAGATLLADATPARTAAIVALMSDLTGEQRGRLARLCRRLVRTLDPAAADKESEVEAAVDAAARAIDEHATVIAAANASPESFNPSI